MVYGCGAGTVKCLVFFFNFLAFIAGLGILIGAAVIYAAPGVSDKVMIELNKSEIGGIQSLKASMIALMVIGGFICLLGFLGCCGALCESGAMLCLFGTIMIAMLIIQVALGITALVSKGKIRDQLDAFLQDEAKWAFGTPPQASAGDNKNSTTACDFYKDLASHNVCCGYDATLNFGLGRCDGYQCVGDVAKIYCKDQLWTLLVRGAKVIGIVALVFIFLELAATIFGCCLWTAIRKGERLYEYA